MTPREGLTAVLLALAMAVTVGTPFLLAGGPAAEPGGAGALAWLAGMVGLGLGAAGLLLVGIAAAEDPPGRAR